jgi:peroxiredoxin
MSALDVGSAAPDFVLPEASERAVQLSREVRRGTVVLVFYPTDWGVICTLEMKAFQSILKDIEGAEAHILGVSVNSTTSHRSWKEQMGITWDLLSDVGGTVSSLYGVLTPDGRFLAGHAERSVFVIDVDQVVRYAWVAPDPSVQPDYQAILAVCRSCRPHQ